jgi:hypothetical protein
LGQCNSKTFWTIRCETECWRFDAALANRSYQLECDNISDWCLELYRGNEAIQEQKEREDKFKYMEEKFDVMQSMMEKLIIGLSKTTDQQQLNTVAQSMYSSGILKQKM